MEYTIFVIDKTFNFNKWQKKNISNKIRFKYYKNFEYDDLLKSGYIKEDLIIKNNIIEVYNIYAPNSKMWFNLFGSLFDFGIANSIINYLYSIGKSDIDVLFLNIGVIQNNNMYYNIITSSFLSFNFNGSDII